MRDFDAQQVAADIQRVRPMTAESARQFIARASDMMEAANSADSRPEAIARRRRLVVDLESMDEVIQTSKIDQLPENAAAMLRRVVIRAVVELRPCAEARRAVGIRG
jgi:hypothetical protein